jgi:hypothetical protein
VLIAGEYFLLDEEVDVRDSLSAYYHSSMGEFFVGCLSVIVTPAPRSAYPGRGRTGNDAACW